MAEKDLKEFRIIHPVYDKNDSFIPFIHAIKLALCSRGNLEIIDIRKKGAAREQISIRAVLEQWGLLPEGSQRSDVTKTGIKVTKIVKPGGGRDRVTKRLDHHLNDMLVIGARPGGGVGGLFHEDLAGFLARTYRQTTLYIPVDARPIVDRYTGELRVRRILFPVAESPAPDPALIVLHRFLSMIAVAPPQVIGFHAGASFPYVSPSLLEGLAWKESCVEGKGPAAAIGDAATENDVDLIVMSTNGRDTLSQKIAGSITEQLIKTARCPVLAVVDK